MASFYEESSHPATRLRVKLISSSHVQNRQGCTRLAEKLSHFYAVSGSTPVPPGGVSLSMSAYGGRKFNQWTYKEILEKYQSGYLVIVMLGDNDARSMLADQDSYLNETKKAWIEGFNRFSSYVKGIELESSEPGWIVLMGVIPMMHELRSCVIDGVNDINFAFSELAREYSTRVGYVNMYAQVPDKINLFRKDKIHLSEKGEDSIFAVITKIIDVVGRMRGSHITLGDLALFNEG